MTEVTNYNNEKNQVSLSINGNSFADFILNFLGKKEKLRYKNPDNLS